MEDRIIFLTGTASLKLSQKGAPFHPLELSNSVMYFAGFGKVGRVTEPKS